MAFGSLDLFFGGLEGIIGPPQMVLGSLMNSMAADHCSNKDSTIFFTSSNGVSTFSEQEWKLCARARSDRTRVGVREGGDMGGGALRTWDERRAGMQRALGSAQRPTCARASLDSIPRSLAHGEIAVPWRLAQCCAPRRGANLPRAEGVPSQGGRRGDGDPPRQVPSLAAGRGTGGADADRHQCALERCGPRGIGVGGSHRGPALHWADVRVRARAPPGTGCGVAGGLAGDGGGGAVAAAAPVYVRLESEEGGGRKRSGSCAGDALLSGCATLRGVHRVLCAFRLVRYEKYNAALRKESGVEMLINKFQKLCLGNNYACAPR